MIRTRAPLALVVLTLACVTQDARSTTRDVAAAMLQDSAPNVHCVQRGVLVRLRIRPATSCGSEVAGGVLEVMTSSIGRLQRATWNRRATDSVAWRTSSDSLIAHFAVLLGAGDHCTDRPTERIINESVTWRFESHSFNVVSSVSAASEHFPAYRRFGWTLVAWEMRGCASPP